jgi:hypothetical protein
MLGSSSCSLVEVFVSPPEVSSDVLHECRHARTLVIACDVRVKIPPCLFDLVVVGTIRQQEVKLDSATGRGCQTEFHLVRRMNRVRPQRCSDESRPTRAIKLIRQSTGRTRPKCMLSWTPRRKEGFPKPARREIARLQAESRRLANEIKRTTGELPRLSPKELRRLAKTANGMPPSYPQALFSSP